MLNYSRKLGLLIPSLALAIACGGGSTTRMVDDPTGQATTYGGPKNTSYHAEVDTSQGAAQVTVFQSSLCDVIPITVMQRYEEVLHGDKVVQRNPVTKKQVAGDPTGTVPCDQTYARNVEVFLAAGDGRHSIGKTDERGVVSADLAQVFQVANYDQVPDKVEIVLRPLRAREVVSAGSVSLSELKRQQGRVGELLASLEEILAKGETGASPAEITKSYEVYATLQAMAPHDPRVKGISARFWELFYGRKQEEGREKMEKNLKALGAAKETLKVMGDAAIPLYVQAAVNSGTLDSSAVEWSTLRLISALRAAPTVCANFSFGSVGTYGWPADARLAASYVNFARGDSYASILSRACGR